MRNFFEDFAPLIAMLVLLIVIILSGLAVDNATCDAKTANIGFTSRWSILGGCQIEVTPHQWIPLESYYFKQE